LQSLARKVAKRREIERQHLGVVIVETLFEAL
jgi:hypothetical protein